MALTNAAFAQDDGLYDAPLPPDAAFVRFIGVDHGQFQIFGQEFPFEALGAGDYGVVSAGAAPDAIIGQYYTVVKVPSGDLEVRAEAPREDGRVMVQLVNLTDKLLELKVSDGSITVVSGVAPFQIGARAVNPVRVPLQVFDGTTPVGESQDMILQRGKDPTFVVRESGVEILYSLIVRTDLTE